MSTYSHVDTIEVPSPISIIGGTPPLQTPPLSPFPVTTPQRTLLQTPIMIPPSIMEEPSVENLVDYRPMPHSRPVQSPVQALIVFDDDDEKKVKSAAASSASSSKFIPMSGSPQTKFPAGLDDVAETSGLEGLLNSPDRKVRAKALQTLEHRILVDQGRCDNRTIDNLRTRTFALDANRVKNATAGAYDHNFQNAMACMVDALISPEASIPSFRFQEWLSNIEMVSGGNSGQLLSAARGNDKLFAVKTNEFNEDKDVTHEALVGLAAINNLRSRVPNFMHTYGVLYCAPPAMGANYTALLCRSRSPSTTHVVLEYIEGNSLADIVMTLSLSQILQIYLQILNALNVAYKAYDFTHYDLHAGNILVQHLPYIAAVPFYHSDGSVSYLHSQYLPRIIDYGTSHIKLYTQNFGDYDLEEAEATIDAERSYPMHDAFKCFMMLYATTNHTLEMAEFFNIVYRFFDPATTVSQRRKIQESGAGGDDYFQPHIDMRHLTHDALIDYILQHVAIDFLSPNVEFDSILTVCEDKCVNWNQFNTMITDEKSIPSSIIDYAATVRAVDNLMTDENKSRMQGWLKALNIREIYDNEKDVYLNILKVAAEETLRVKDLYKITDPTFDSGEYSDTLDELTTIRYNMRRFEIWLSSVAFAFDYVGDASYVSHDITDVNERIALINEKLVKNKLIADFNIDNASSYMQKGMVKYIKDVSLAFIEG